MKSKEFTIGLRFSIKARTFQLLLKETNDEECIKIVLGEEDKKVFLEETYYIDVDLRNEKTVNKLHKKMDNLEEIYKASKASANIIRLRPQIKKIIQSL